MYPYTPFIPSLGFRADQALGIRGDTEKEAGGPGNEHPEDGIVVELPVSLRWDENAETLT